MMILLRDKSGNIQFEAFHVFKVFVANPKNGRVGIESLRQSNVRRPHISGARGIRQVPH